eukprot:CAMPEP_0113616486 /NCGR_PEP_ID=MMETSP0017_2-20120614/8264_1 /TAXON_ID=2856 /ORGANISM="Cylindrotheca closterium" /LENGTH=628 /DNA_ID=CAMNT_0000525801 /DNA_START=96 /DNA_END=1982 /DNA_ORIENTATION=+ /assembly_acc=CAM_ASM_000147
MKLDRRGLVLSSISKPHHYKANILSRLGGKEDVFAIMTTFCIHLQNDLQLAKFYGSYNLEDLRLLMIDLFNCALLSIFPSGFDLKQHVAITQYHQLSSGMGSQEFDLVIQSFRNALFDEPIPHAVVLEAIEYITTLRAFFDDEKMQQRAKKIADSMLEDEPEEIEIEIPIGHEVSSVPAPKIRSWSRGSKGRRLRKVAGTAHVPAKHSEEPEGLDVPIRRMPRRGSLQYRIKSVMPVRRISVPKENDKDPGPLIRKISLEHKVSSLSGSSEKSSADNNNKVETARNSGTSGEADRSKGSHSRNKTTEQPESRKAPTGTFSFDQSRGATERPIRRMPRRGSLQYRIRSAIPVKRLSVPKENDKDPGPVLKPTLPQKSLDHKVSSLSESSNQDVEIARGSGISGPKRRSDNSKESNNNGARRSKASNRDVTRESEQQQESRDAPEQQPIRRMPRRGSLQYRIRSVIPVKRLSVPKENDKDPGPPVLPPPQRPRLSKASTKSSQKKNKSSQSSLLNNNSSMSSFNNNKKRNASPHRRLFQAIKRVGSKDRHSLNSAYSSSAEDSAPFVSSEELEQEEEKEKFPSYQQKHPTTAVPTTKQQQQQQTHHDVKDFGHHHHADRVSASWEKALVL